MDNNVLHEILLRKARAAEYTNFEVEQINIQSEALFIRYFLERETNKILENSTIEEETIKKFYEDNKSILKKEKEVKIETIFIRDLEKAKKVLNEINQKNFKTLKKENDEKVNVLENDEFISISRIHPQIAELINKNKKGIIKQLVQLEDGAHIIWIKDIIEEREATYEESKEFITIELKKSLFNQIYENLINSIINEKVSLDNPSAEKENK
ncbi:peptidylprolyl isomerase [Fusobacterium massiliense]|uniref:peptidylprolyl isomerase n=1 Tax=Fusobacterium massiliense TaxID=1852365 RepID=UPI0028EE49E0|nr:peptidylprolyl isomerase [Fusobacterium massiliense]